MAARGALTTCVLVGLFATATATAGAQSACDDLAGSVSPDQTCRVHTAGAGYTVDLSFATDFPDQQPLADYLIATRDDFVEFAQLPPERDWPYALAGTSTTYRSGDGASGTQTLVLRLSQNANPHPVAWYRAFNYDLGTKAPITLQTLFGPETKPLDVVFPAVLRELEKRWEPEDLASMLGDVDNGTFQNFALTDDAVIFFFGQGQLLGHTEGPLEVSVPRAELAPSLA